jgi:hypothetical protein
MLREQPGVEWTTTESLVQRENRESSLEPSVDGRRVQAGTNVVTHWLGSGHQTGLDPPVTLQDQDPEPVETNRAKPDGEEKKDTPANSTEWEIQENPETLPSEEEAEEVKGVIDSPTLTFLVKFKNGKSALVKKKACRDKYPRLLCDFLLDKIQMNSPETGGWL